MVQVDFNTSLLSYQALLEHFWNSHNPNRDSYKGRQYLSLLLYQDASELAAIQSVKNKLEKQSSMAIQTEIAPFNSFTLAEERHQKYFIKRYPDAVNKLQELYPSFEIFNNATLPARLNSFVKGWVTMAELRSEIKNWPIAEAEQEKLLHTIKSIRW